MVKRRVQRDRNETNHEWVMDTDCIYFCMDYVASIVDEMNAEDVDDDSDKKLIVSLQSALLDSCNLD